MEQASFQQKLKSLWQQGSREVALSFLRRALSEKNTLAQWASALAFDGVAEYLQTITLAEVLNAPAVGQPEPLTLEQPRTRRRRRSPEEMTHLRAEVLLLLATDNQVRSTAEICAEMESAGHEVDMVRISSILKHLLAEGQVLDLGGKPKRWQYAQGGRKLAEPMHIKKRQAG